MQFFHLFVKLLRLFTNLLMSDVIKIAKETVVPKVSKVPKVPKGC